MNAFSLDRDAWAEVQASRSRHGPKQTRLRRSLLFTRVRTGLIAEQARGVSSVVEDREAQLAQARGIGDRLDLDDLVVPDRELEHKEQPTMAGHDDPYGTIHKSGPRGLGAP